MFGRCVVDARRRLLWRDSVPVPLTAKTFDVLAFLLDHPHRVITKEEFFQRLWPGTIVLEASLVRQISLLRKALDQRPDSHEYLVTIPGRGYEFVATVEWGADLPDGLEEPDLSSARPSVVPSEELASHDAPPVSGVSLLSHAQTPMGVGSRVRCDGDRREHCSFSGATRRIPRKSCEPCDRRRSSRAPSANPPGRPTEK